MSDITKQQQEFKRKIEYQQAKFRGAIQALVDCHLDLVYDVDVCGEVNVMFASDFLSDDEEEIEDELDEFLDNNMNIKEITGILDNIYDKSQDLPELPEQND